MKQKQERVISLIPAEPIPGKIYDYETSQRLSRTAAVSKIFRIMPKYAEIIRNPADPRLYIPAKKIKNVQDTEVIDIAKTLVAHRLIENALGIAGNQIGCNLNICAIAVLDEFGKDTANSYVMMNLRIIGTPSTDPYDVEWGLEGCLSSPGIWAEVCRLKRIKFRCSTLTHPKEEEYEASGLFARVIAHEYDHLRGKLFSDLGPLVRNLRADPVGQVQLQKENLHAEEFGFTEPLD